MRAAGVAPIDLAAAMTASRGSVQVGFNRRFAPASLQLKCLLAATPGPKACSYRVLAGKVDPAHWSANFAESGSRIVGEACHFLDWFCFLFDSRPVRLLATPLGSLAGRNPYPDAFCAQLEFADGSNAQLIYSAEGDPAFPKETISVYASGLVAEVVNFLTLTVHQHRKRRLVNFSSKGHAEQMAAWRAFLRAEAPLPFPWPQTHQSMALTFAVLESIQRAGAVEVGAG